MEIEAVLSFWLGPLDADGLAAPEVAARWYKKDEAFDAEIRERFGATSERVRRGGCDDWLATARGRLAYVIVLDQFSRNLFRDTPRAFESDEQALRAAEQGIELGHDLELVGDERCFLYLPFMHAEDLSRQDRCVSLFRAFHETSAGALREHLNDSVRFAIAHRDIIARWGRFPHRNAILGRATTDAEREFLSQPGSSF